MFPKLILPVSQSNIDKEIMLNFPCFGGMCQTFQLLLLVSGLKICVHVKYPKCWTSFMTLTTSFWNTLHTEYKQRKPVHSSVFQFNFKTLIRASYPLYTALEVIGGSTPYFFSFVTLINKTTLTILIFTARIATQTNAMTQQITVHDVRAVFHKGNVSLLKSLTVLYLSLLFEAFICRTYRKLIKVAL